MEHLRESLLQPLYNNNIKLDSMIFKPKSNIQKKTFYQFAIIDDSKKDIELFETLLRIEAGLNFSLKIWNEFKPALKYFSNLKEAKELSIPDIIFIDFSMPSINGLLALQSLREIKFLDNIPIIMYSSSTKPNLTHDFKSSNATGFFKKPLDVSSFLDFLEN